MSIFALISVALAAAIRSIAARPQDLEAPAGDALLFQQDGEWVEPKADDIRVIGFNRTSRRLEHVAETASAHNL